MDNLNSLPCEKCFFFFKKTAILYIIKHDTQILIIFFWQRELLVCKLKKGKENSDEKKRIL